MLGKVKTSLDNILKYAVSLLMSILLMDVVWQVFSRYVLRDPSSFTDELARFLLIWVALLGAAYVTGMRMHLAIDLIPSKYHTAWFNRLIYVLMGVFATFALIVGGWRLVVITLALEQRSAALQIPLGIVYSVIPMCGIIILLYVIIELVNSKQQEG